MLSAEERGAYSYSSFRGSSLSLQKKDCDRTLHQFTQIGTIRLLYKFGCATGFKVFDRLIPPSPRLFNMSSESSDKVILRSFVDWLRSEEHTSELQSPC